MWPTGGNAVLSCVILRVLSLLSFIQNHTEGLSGLWTVQNFYNTCIVPAIHHPTIQQSQSVYLSVITFFLSLSGLPLKQLLLIVEDGMITDGETKKGERTGLFFVDDRDKSYCSIVLHAQQSYKTWELKCFLWRERNLPKPRHICPHTCCHDDLPSVFGRNRYVDFREGYLRVPEHKWCKKEEKKCWLF